MDKMGMNQAMLELVKDWYEGLSNGQKTALRLLKFSPSVIGSMFFFDGETGNCGCVGDYGHFIYEIQRYGQERDDFSLGINWKFYHENESIQYGRENAYNSNALISKLPKSLRREVVSNLCEQDETYCKARKCNLTNVRNARKALFWEAIEALKKEVMEG